MILNFVDDAGVAPHVSTFGDPDYFFSSGIFPSTARIECCTTCVIRPRLFKEGNIGALVQDILNAGFEISAVELFRLEMSTANEFFDVYKGVISHYNVNRFFKNTKK